MNNITKRCAALLTACALSLCVVAPGALAEKKETVFVMADANGNVDHVVVSDRLYNDDKQDVLTDYSTLRDIENVGGDQAFTNEDGVITWQANGENIQYEGTTDAPLPVNVHITYKLNGQEIAPADLKGRSGHLDIVVSCEAAQTVTAEIDGAEEEIPLPFLTAGMLFIDPDIYSDVEVENGRLIDVGNMQVAVCVGFPGVSEALDLQRFDDLDVDLPTTATISAEVKDFATSGMYVIAMNHGLEQLDVDSDTLDELKDTDFEQLKDDLADAISQLKDGSGDLADGAAELRDGAKDLNDGAKELYDGAGDLKDGAKEVKDGAKELSDGLTEIDDNSDDLADGAKKIFEGILDTANDSLHEKEKDFKKLDIELHDLTIDNYQDEITRLETELLDNVEDYVYEQADRQLRGKVEAAVRDEVVRQVNAGAKDKVRAEVKKAARQQVREKVEAGADDLVRQKVEEGAREKVQAEILKHVRQMVEDGARQQVETAVRNPDEATIASEVDRQMQTPEVRTMIEAEVKNQLASDQVRAMIARQLEETVRGEVEKNRDAIRQQVSAAVEAKVREKVTAAVRAQIAEAVKAAFQQGQVPPTSGNESGVTGASVGAVASVVSGGTWPCWNAAFTASVIWALTAAVTC